MNDEETIFAKTILIPRIVELKRNIAKVKEEYAALLKEEADLIAHLTPEETVKYFKQKGELTAKA